MLLINGAQLQALKERLPNIQNRQQCLEELRHMLEIKQVLLWRADEARNCCGWGVAACIGREVQLLESAVEAMEDGRSDEVMVLLDEYTALIGDRT